MTLRHRLVKHALLLLVPFYGDLEGTPAPRDPTLRVASDAPTGSSLATPGAERFVIRGLKIGDGPGPVQSFLRSLELHPTGEKSESHISVEGIAFTLPFLLWAEYTNGKAGIDEITARLSFTPPFPNSEGTVPLISGIYYTTRYGDGVSPADVKNDLQKKYGKASAASGGSLYWDIEGTRNFGGLRARADITQAERQGLPNTLTLSVVDSGFDQRVQRLAEQHVRQMDGTRAKDTKKPSF